jgi:hypothetical protein
MSLTYYVLFIYAQIFMRRYKMMRLLRVFPVARRILLPLLLEIYLSAILLSDAQRHCASTGWTVIWTELYHDRRGLFTWLETLIFPTFGHETREQS